MKKRAIRLLREGRPKNQVRQITGVGLNTLNKIMREEGIPRAKDDDAKETQPGLPVL